MNLATAQKSAFVSSVSCEIDDDLPLSGNLISNGTTNTGPGNGKGTRDWEEIKHASDKSDKKKEKNLSKVDSIENRVARGAGNERSFGSVKDK